MSKLKIPEASYIYSILIYMGYFNLTTYYSNFGIEIYSFLSIPEMLLAFLNLTQAIIVLISIFCFLYLLATFKIGMSKDEQSEVSTDNFILIFRYSIKKLKVVFRRFKWKNIYYYLIVLRNVFSICVSICSALYLFLGLIIFTDLLFGKRYITPHTGMIIFMGLLWFLIFNSYAKIYLYQKYKVKYLWFVISIYFIFGTINIHNSNKAHYVLSGKTESTIKFFFKDTVIITDHKLIYVGMTADYIFLRNIDKKENIIYPRRNVDKIEMFK